MDGRAPSVQKPRQIMMQHQQQMVMTSDGQAQPVYLGHSYQTSSVVTSYHQRQSIIIGALLITAGSLSIFFSSAEIGISVNCNWSTYSGVALGDGIWCGVMVSIYSVN